MSGTREREDLEDEGPRDDSFDLFLCLFRVTGKGGE